MATNTAPAFDFSAVKVEEADLPKNGAGRNRRHAVNPFTEVLAASYEAFKANGNAGRQIKVPGKQVSEAVYLIRQAADDLRIGSRVILRNAKNEPVEAKDVKNSTALVTVLFSGKDRKQKKDAAATATPATAESPTEG
jgi:hypothetical protein